MVSRRRWLLVLASLMCACSRDVRAPAPAVDTQTPPAAGARLEGAAARTGLEGAAAPARLEEGIVAGGAGAVLAARDPHRCSTLSLMEDPGDWGPSQTDQADEFLEAYALLCSETVRCRVDGGRDVESCNRLLDRFAASYPNFRPLMAFWKGRNHEVRGDPAAAESLYSDLAQDPAFRQAVWMNQPLLARAYRRRVDIALSREDLPRALSLLRELEGALNSFAGFEETKAQVRYEIAKCSYFREETRGEALQAFRAMSSDPLLQPQQRLFMQELLDFEDWVARGGGANLPRDAEEAIHTLLGARRDPADMETIVVDGERLRPAGVVQWQDPEGIHLTNLQESLSLVMTARAPLYVDRARILVRGRDVLVRICEGRGDDPGVCEIHNFRSTRLGWVYAGRVASTDPGDAAGSGQELVEGVSIGIASLSTTGPAPGPGPGPADCGQDPSCVSGTPLAQLPDLDGGGTGPGLAGKRGACLKKKVAKKGKEVEQDLGCDWVEDLGLWPEAAYVYSKTQVFQGGTDRARIGHTVEQGQPFTFADVKVENECHLKGTGLFCSEYSGYDKDAGPGREPVLAYALRRPRGSRFLDRMRFKAPFAAGTGFSAGGLSLSRELAGVDWFGAAPSGMGPSSPSAVNAVAYGLCQNGEKTGACARKVCGNFGGGALYNATGIYLDVYAIGAVSGAVQAALGPVLGQAAAVAVAALAIQNQNELPFFSTHFSTGVSENIFAVDYSRSGRNAQGNTVRACRGEPILASQEGYAAGVQNNIPSGNGSCDVADFATGFSHCIKSDEQDGNHVTIHHLKRLDALRCLSTGSSGYCGAWDYKTTSYHLMGPLHYFSANRQTCPEAQTHWATGQEMQGGVLVEEGMYLLQGMRLGYCDDTGISALDHLHFEVAARVLSLPTQEMEDYADTYERVTGKDKKTKWKKGERPDFLSTHTVPQLLEGELMLTPGQCLVSSNEEPGIRRCAFHSDCEPGERCNKPPKFLYDDYPAGICSSRCIRDDQCPQWYRCDLENTGTCYRPDGCQRDGDCPPGFRCGRDAQYGDEPVCIGCRSNVDCGAGTTPEEQVLRAQYQLCTRTTQVPDVAKAWNRATVQTCRALFHKKDGFLYDECSATYQCATGSKCMKLDPADRAAGEAGEGKRFDPVKKHYGTPDTWKPERELANLGEDRGVCVAVPDRDGDWVLDGRDNCERVPNPGQEDADRNGIGDACDQTLSVDVLLEDACRPPQEHFLGGVLYSFREKAFHAHGRASTVWGLPFDDTLGVTVRLRYENFVPAPVVALTFYACPGDCGVQDAGKQRLWFNEVPSTQWKDEGKSWRVLEIRRTVPSFLCADRYNCGASGQEGRTWSLFVNAEVNHSDPAIAGYHDVRVKLGTYQIVDPAKHSPCPLAGTVPGAPVEAVLPALEKMGYQVPTVAPAPEADAWDRIRVNAHP